MVLLVVFCFSAFLSLETYAVQIVPQSTVSFPVEQGHRVILPFNYTLALSESDSALTVDLKLNGTSVISYIEARGTIIENKTVGPLIGRHDVQILSSPRSYVGLLIQQTTLNDTGRYTWSITIDAAKTLGTPLDLIIGNEPELAALVHHHVGGRVYTLTCTVTGGIPLPNITILNGTEVIHTDQAPTTSGNVTVVSPTVFYCVGTNALGSKNSSFLQLPISTTTMSPSTSTVTSTGDNTASTTTKPPDKNQTEDNTGQTPTTAKAPGNPPNVALIVGVICGCVGGFCIIVILVCVFKKKTKPGKKVLTLEQRIVEGNDNTCEQQENTTKLSTEQEEEEKQQQNLKGPRGNTKPAGGEGHKKRDAHTNAEDTGVRKIRNKRISNSGT